MNCLWTVIHSTAHKSSFAMELIQQKKRPALNYHFHFDNLALANVRFGIALMISHNGWKIIEWQIPEKSKTAKRAILQKWYFMTINYRVFSCFMIRSFCISLCDTGKLKLFVRVHLFRKMAIYIEFDHLLTVNCCGRCFFRISSFNYEFSGDWSSVNWSNLRKTADKWKVWKTFKQFFVHNNDDGMVFQFFGFGTMDNLVFSKSESHLGFLCAMRRRICCQREI